MFVVVESLDRSLSLGVGVHLHKTEPLATSNTMVLDDLGIRTVPKAVNHFSKSVWVTE